jgi:hypothetical protein
MEHRIKVQVESHVDHILIVSTSFPDRLHYANQLDDTAAIPCEICKELIKLRYFEGHLVG